MSPSPLWLRSFDQIDLDDIGLVGGKNASLGELRRALSDKSLVPHGFAITATAFRDVIAFNNLEPKIAALLEETQWDRAADAEKGARAIRELISSARWPTHLAAVITRAYRALANGKRCAVAVRSSATAEDLPEASFAGLHQSFLNVRGEKSLNLAVRQCFASLYTERAINYRNIQGFPHDSVALSVGVQCMVDASRGSSGVIFTLDTESGFSDVVLISGVFGLGETIVQGLADPDEFLVHKPGLARGRPAIIRHRIGSKQVRMIADRRGTPIRKTSRSERATACLSDADILLLAEQAVAIEKHYSARAGHPKPMDIEWARDGESGRLYILQARPETAHARKDQLAVAYRLLADGPILVSGQAVGERIASGVARIVNTPEQLGSVKEGDVIVADSTSPDWEPVMRKAAAIVTERGGRTCHAAIIARELGIPAIVGATGARGKIAGGEPVTVSCSEGQIAHVRRGRLPFSVEPIEIRRSAARPTKVMVNMADPDKAFRTASLPVDGVGLARIEFIINNSIAVHPMALLEPERVNGKRARAEIDRRVAAFAAERGGEVDGAEFFVTRLAEGIAMIAAAFYPRPVIVRTSDFKTNEYRALLGGNAFEEVEENPMIGFRGAARYVHPSYAKAFALECKAIARVRDGLGLDNVIVMIPFCRRLDEARKVLELMAEQGLRRNENGLKIYAMAEIPSNAILIDGFAELFDGFSIGSNDLTQLTLGVDRDSAILADAFDEGDPAVLELIHEIIAGAHRHRRPCGLCGQAPSDRPDFAQWLVEQGIDSISLNPDSVAAYLARAAKHAEAGPANEGGVDRPHLHKVG